MNCQNSSSNFSERFQARKKAILASLITPAEEYDDLSPKGSIDEAIRPLIDQINDREGFVTTSSCAGRISVFAEGAKDDDITATPSNANDEVPLLQPALPGLKNPTTATATSGGKGGGGTWLYVSHDPVTSPLPGCALGKDPLMSLFNLSDSREKPKAGKNSRFIHFKFEAMILHVLAGSLTHAQHLLSAALQAGFRESGIQSVVPNAKGEIMPMVAIRSTGLALDSIIGFVDTDGEAKALIDETYLQAVLQIANSKFSENSARIEKFSKHLTDLFQHTDTANGAVSSHGKEGNEERRRRKIAEGLETQRQMAVRTSNGSPNPGLDDFMLETSLFENGSIDTKSR